MIDHNLVKKLRIERCWSQEHLALVAGLSLRTVQRVESQGHCSLASRQAIAAAFDRRVVDLTLQRTPDLQRTPERLSENDAKIKIAISWLEIIDAGEYERSWQRTAPLFQEHISMERWAESLELARKPLGSVISRVLAVATMHCSLPNMADGQYIVMELATNFEQRQSSTETITLSEINSEWQVAGYFIR